MAEQIHDDEEAIFLAALQKATPGEQAAYLEGACGGRPELHRRVVELLNSHEDSHGPFDAPHPAVARTMDMPAEPLIAAAPGAVIGPYKLLQQIGEGGMGVVYMAEQAAPVRRKVALKIIKPGMDSREVIARFEAERQALALMDHPNIASVFDGGATEAGRPYFVMELVRGVPITEYCDQNNLPVHERLELFVTVCHAVQHAHQKGIIHRDIKPSNILVTIHDGRPVPKVIDFGVAKAIGQQLTDKTLFTQFAQIVGTPLYMSPEQAELTGLDIDTRGDIYSLGVLLYELLTGTTPFEGGRMKKAALDEIRRMIREEDPPSPSMRLSSTAGETQSVVAAHRRVDVRGLSRLVRGDLDWIVMKALEKDRNRRYETANGFAADIGRYLSDEPVVACPPSATYRFHKFVRRNKGPVAAVSLLILALVGGVIGTALGLLESKRQAGLAIAAQNKETQRATSESKARQDEQTQREEAEKQTRVANAALKDVSTANELLKRQLRIASAERLSALSYTKRSEAPEISLLLALESGRATRKNEEGILKTSHQALLDALGVLGARPLVGHQGTIRSIAISPDGRWLVTGSWDRTARIWDLTAANPAAKPLVLSGHQGSILSVAFSPDSRWVVTGSGDWTARIWDLTAENPNANPRVLDGHQGGIRRLAVSPDGRWVVTASWDKTARIWDLAGADPGDSVRVLSGHLSYITSVAITPNSRHVITGSWDGTARIWDLTAKDPSASSRVLRGHRGAIWSLAISPDSRWGVTGSADGTARVWNLMAEDLGTGSRILSGHHSAIFCVAVSFDGRFIITGSDDNTARLWDLTDDNTVSDRGVLSGHQGPITDVVVSNDSRWVVTGSSDRTARIWDLRARNPTASSRVLNGHQRGIFSVAISPDSRWVVTGSDEKVARIWGVGSDPCVLSGHLDQVDCAVISPDSRWVVTGSEDNTARVWDLTAKDSGSNPRVLSGHTGGIYCVAISPDSRWVVTGSYDKSAMIWDLADETPGTSARVLSGHQDLVWSVAISSDNRWIVTGCLDKTARIWDLTAENPSANPRVLSGHQDHIMSVAISPDSRWVVTGSKDATARVWDLTAENPSAIARVLTGHTSRVRGVAISPDNRHVVTVSWDKTARIWDLTADDPGTSSRVLSGHLDQIWSVAISPDGRWVVTGSWDKTARVWDLMAENPSANPRVLSGHQDRIRSVAISPDSRWVVTGSLDKTVRIWDLTTANPSAAPLILSGFPDEIWSVAISPDGRWVVARGHLDRTALVWQWRWDDLVTFAGSFGRNLSTNEWERYFPGQPYHKTFPELPVPSDPQTTLGFIDRPNTANLLQPTAMIDSWKFETKNGGEGSLRVEDAAIVFQVGATDPDQAVSAVLQDLDLIEHQMYCFKFQAKATERRSVSLWSSNDMNYAIGLHADFSVGTEFQNFEFRFRAQFLNEKKTRIQFKLGGESGAVYVKDLSLTECQ